MLESLLSSSSSSSLWYRMRVMLVWEVEMFSSGKGRVEEIM